MNGSILQEVREVLVGDVTDTSFDKELMFNINMALNFLWQLGVPKAKDLRIKDETATWDDLIGDRCDLEQVKEYITLKTKTLFDPPSAGFVLEQYNKQLAELEYRINITVDDQSGRGGENE